ncbi:MAG: hypothetical protein CMH57_06505 [Myxococcales bacterium]|nr:hypothetical protein [Myxococcales bacterium]
MKPKLFRDPVHDIIAFNTDDVCGRLQFALIRTREVQRLRRIRQLGLAQFVYHGAEHSRFAHSLGVTHISGRMLEQIGHRTALSDEEKMLTVAGALLHDIGHGPFSHAMEKIAGIEHEALSRQIICDPDSEVNQALRAVDSTFPEQVAALIHHDQPRSFRTDIVSSQLDADRLDYILRDGMATGVRIGVYDLERIMSMLEARPEHLVISGRATEAVEGYLLARFHMFKQVYLHKAVRAAEKMLEAALGRAAELLRDGASLPIINPALASLLRQEAMSSHAYTSLDDTDVWVALKAWTQASDPVLVELCHGLLNRRLYKTLDLATTDEDRISEAIEAACDVVRRRGGDPAYHVMVDRAEDTPYKPYVPDTSSTSRPIMVSRNDHLYRIEELSEIAHLLGRDRYEITRLCFPRRFREPITEAVEALLGPDFMISRRRPTGSYPLIGRKG